MPEEADITRESNARKYHLDQEADSDDEESQTTDGFPAYGLLRAAVFSDVTKWVEEDRARRRAAVLTAASISMVALIAIGGFLVNQLLVFNVERHVTQAVADNLSAVSFPSQVAALNYRVFALDQASGFTSDEAHGIIQSIETLYESGIRDSNISPDVRSQNIAHLMFAVETAVQSFAAADREDLVSRITDVAPRVSERSSVVAPIAVTITARRLIGMAGGADSWEDRAGIEQRLYQKYELYAERSRDTGYPELYFAFELIIRFMERRPDNEIRQLAAEVEDLNEVDREAFVMVMKSLADGSFTTESTAASERVRARTRGFLEAYGDSIPALSQL